MSQPTTHVLTESGYTTITTQVGDLVYVLNSRTGTYKHYLHRVGHIVNGVAVTECNVWARAGTVAQGDKDCFTRCENGCQTITKAQYSADR